MEELDTELATRPPQPKKDRSQNKTLDQVMTELDWESDRSETLPSLSTEKTE
jgi:hypothetical protein